MAADEQRFKSCATIKLLYYSSAEGILLPPQRQAVAVTKIAFHSKNLLPLTNFDHRYYT